MTCKYCEANKENEDSFLFETENWKIFLSHDQCYLGHCLIILKRHSPDLNDLNEQETKNFFEVIKRLEDTMKRAFNATMFNISFLMNDTYNIKPQMPHVYANFKPRYSKEVQISGLTFDDPEFGFHYSASRTREISEKVRKEVLDIIRSCL